MIGVGYICHWAVILDYRMPDGEPFIAGFVHEHPTFKDGTLIYTSTIIFAEGRNVVTKSGSCYTLKGSPDKGWLKMYLEDHPDFDLDNPFLNLSETSCKTNDKEV